MRFFHIIFQLEILQGVLFITYSEAYSLIQILHRLIVRFIFTPISSYFLNFAERQLGSNWGQKFAAKSEVSARREKTA